MFWEWYKFLFDKVKEFGIIIFSSFFDYIVVDFLEEFGVFVYKIVLFEVIDLLLIKYVVKIGKLMIILMGMVDEQEIQEVIIVVCDGGCKEFVVLYCVSGYLVLVEDYNLVIILDMVECFGVIIGLFDYIIDNMIVVVLVVFGVNVIEKYVILDWNGGGLDDSFLFEL